MGRKHFAAIELALVFALFGNIAFAGESTDPSVNNLDSAMSGLKHEMAQRYHWSLTNQELEKKRIEIRDRRSYICGKGDQAREVRYMLHISTFESEKNATPKSCLKLAGLLEDIRYEQELRKSPCEMAKRRELVLPLGSEKAKRASENAIAVCYEEMQDKLAHSFWPKRSKDPRLSDQFKIYRPEWYSVGESGTSEGAVEKQAKAGTGLRVE